MIFGLDGATYDIILPLVKQGELIFFKNLLENGVWASLETIIPPLTPGAWTSFMTGVNPGKHGLQDFLYIDEEYRIRLSYRRTKTIWSVLSSLGKKVITLHVPFTYPPEPVNGIMISGFDTPSLDANFIYPQEFREILFTQIPDYALREQVKYLDNDKGREEFANEIFRLTDIRVRTAEFLLKNYEYDVFMVTFMGIDHMQHWYWKFMDKTHPQYKPCDNKKFGNKIAEIYKFIDEKLVRLAEYIPDNAYIILMSDHGAGPNYMNFYVNNLLAEMGLIKFKENPQVKFKKLLYEIGLTPQTLSRLAMHSLFTKKIAKTSGEGRVGFVKKFGLTFNDIDWQKTYAFSYGYYGQIYINSKERFKFGIVDKYSRERIVREIINELNKLKDPCRKGKLLTKAWLREEIYHGGFVETFPDIITSFGNFGYTSSIIPFPTQKLFAPTITFKSGEHRLNGIFGCIGPRVKRGRLHSANILDIAPTIFAILGLKIPEGFDGRVLEIFE